jgi:hypothetical protein
VRIRPGIHFADDPAFKGQKRELVAQDYVYAFKRFADPANRSPGWAEIEDQKFIGLAALREEAVAKNKPFDYDRPIEGIRALDRYTLQFRIEEPRPRFIELLSVSDLYGAVAREVVEFYGARGRSSWRTGGAARSSCWSAIPISATWSTTPSRRPATPKRRRSRRASRAGACR